MSRSTVDRFPTTDEGKAFYRAYDSILSRWPSGTTSVDITTREGTTRVNVCGPPTGPPLVLLPGAGATSTVWFDNVASLSAHKRVYAVDLMGDAGRSVNSGRPPAAADDLLDWLDAVLDTLSVTTFSMVGHSYGAMIALAYALRSPDRVENLVLIDPNSCFAGMRASYLLHALPILVRPTEKRERAFLAWETGDAAFDEEWLTLLALGAAHFPKSKTIVPKRPMKEALSRLTVSTTTVILAGLSKVHDSKAVETAVHSLLPTARTVLLDGATHHTLPMMPSPQLNAALATTLTT